MPRCLPESSDGDQRKLSVDRNVYGFSGIIIHLDFLSLLWIDLSLLLDPLWYLEVVNACTVPALMIM
jgi:hypothetical protein